MDIEFDPETSERNSETRGLPFDLVADFDFETALIAQDLREDYGEDRFIAVGVLGERRPIVADTMRGESLRGISLRRANAREVARHEDARS